MKMYTIGRLKWVEFEPGNWRACTPVGTYELLRNGAGRYWVIGPSVRAPDVMAGKLAAQAHYDARMAEGLVEIEKPSWIGYAGESFLIVPSMFMDPPATQGDHQ